MDRQTLRDWVHRFNATGPEDLVDQWSPGPPSRLSAEQQAELATIVEKGPDRAIDGVVRWRRLDLRHVIKERFGVDCDTRYVGKLLHRLGFAKLSVRPQHPAQDADIIEALKKWPRTLKAHLCDLPSRAPELNPVEKWQYPRQNWLSNRVFNSYDAIIDAAYEAWQKLLAILEAITSIGMREWARTGQSQ